MSARLHLPSLAGAAVESVACGQHSGSFQRMAARVREVTGLQGVVSQLPPYIYVHVYMLYIYMLIYAFLCVCIH